MIPPQNILVLAEGQLGDLLLLTPALRAIRTGFPEAQVSVLILQRRGMTQKKLDSSEPVRPADPAGTACVLTSSSAVDQVYEVDRSALRMLKGIHRLRGETGVARWLRSRRFDAVLCTFPEDRFAIYFKPFPDAKQPLLLSLRNSAVCPGSDIDQQVSSFAHDINKVIDELICTHILIIR